MGRHRAISLCLLDEFNMLPIHIKWRYPVKNAFFSAFATAALAAPLMFAQPAAAEVTHYELESPHTQVIFYVSHLGFSHSQGEFLEYDGHFTLDTENPENSSAEATIYAESIHMGHEKWEDHMKNADFFNVTEYPEITFKSTKVEMTGENTAKVTGDLTMLGRTRPVVLDAVLNKIGTHPMSGNTVAGLSATATIKRSDWGMDYGVPNVGDAVELRIEVEGIRKDQ